MCEHVPAGKAPVRHEDRAAAIHIAVYELAESGKFVFEPAGLMGASRYLLESRSYKEIVWSELPPFLACRLRDGRWKDPEGSGCGKICPAQRERTP